jgi:hypothetical protein
MSGQEVSHDMKKYITVLACDPGTANFAYAVTRIRIKQPFRFKILESGMIQNPIRDLTGLLADQTKAFEDEIHGLIEQYGVDVIIAERFMNRGRNGNTGELVSFMLGIMMKIPDTHLTLITAAQWKNAFNKLQDLKELYKEMKQRCRMEPHPIDAVCMSIYSAGMYFDLGHSPFKFLETGFNRFKKNLQATNKDALNGTGKRKARSRKKK